MDAPQMISAPLHAPTRLCAQWSGVRATLGILGGRYYFRVKVLQPLPVPSALAGPDTGPVHLARVGLSVPHVAVGSLGEERGSFGYGGTGFICAGALLLGNFMHGHGRKST